MFFRRKNIFRQLCALNWILEGMSQDQQPPVMPPITSCWKLQYAPRDKLSVNGRSFQAAGGRWGGGGGLGGVWRSGENNRLPPMCTGFVSRTILLKPCSYAGMSPPQSNLTFYFFFRDLNEDPRTIRKRVEKDKATDKDWVTFKQNPARFTQVR